MRGRPDSPSPPARPGPRLVRRSMRSRLTRAISGSSSTRGRLLAASSARGCMSTSGWRAPRRAWLRSRPCSRGFRSSSPSRRTRPTFGSEETGLASTRAEILSLLPRAGAPPVFASYEAWASFAETLVRLELADQITRIWWDVRPHPRFGTLELRMPDQPTRLDVDGRLCRAPAGARRGSATRPGGRQGVLRPEPVGSPSLRTRRASRPPGRRSALHGGGALR